MIKKILRYEAIKAYQDRAILPAHVVMYYKDEFDNEQKTIIMICESAVPDVNDANVEYIAYCLSMRDVKQ